jgi:hypothetical protein
VKPEQAVPFTAQAAFLADTQTVDQHVVVIAQVVQVFPFPGIRISHQPLAKIAVFPACAGENPVPQFPRQQDIPQEQQQTSRGRHGHPPTIGRQVLPEELFQSPPFQPSKRIDETFFFTESSARKKNLPSRRTSE